MNVAFSTTRRAGLMAALASTAIGFSVLYAGSAWAQAAPKVKFATTEGDFVVEVYPGVAPKTVENFLQYVKDKQYDGTIFHRVIGSFMVQGGGFDTAYAQKPTRPPVAHEGLAALAKGGPKNVEGTLAMARTNDPNSASAQFFINVKDNDFLNHSSPTSSGWGYCVFGRVTDGLDTVNAIKAVKTKSLGSHQDVPAEPVEILSASVVSA